MDRRLFLGSGVAGIGGLLIPQESVGRSVGSFERPILEGLIDVEMAELLKDVPQPKYLRVFWRWGGGPRRRISNRNCWHPSDKRFGIEIIPRTEIQGQYSTWTIDGTMLLNVDRVPVRVDSIDDKICNREQIDIRLLTYIKHINTYRRLHTATGAGWFIVPGDAFKI